MDKSVNKKPRAPAKANNSIPAFLLKTYEILDVSSIFNLSISLYHFL